MTITVADQVRCLRREIALRKACYPKWVASGRMKQEESDKELAALQAAHDTLCITWVDITLQPLPQDGKMYRVRSRSDRGVAWWVPEQGVYGWVAERNELDAGTITHWAKFDGGDQP